jgi:3-keto-5-aminohexanoate cleavage enzyme
VTLFDEGKIIIRAAVNEMQPKTVNPNVPYGAEEVAAEAIACARAGASIVHFHSRTDDGAQAVDDDRNGASIYRRAMELTARESDIIMEPTNLPLGNDPSLSVDVPHVWSLVEDPPLGAPLEVVNIDGFRFAHNRTAWDEAEQRLLMIENRRLNRDAAFQAPEVIRDTIACGLVPFFGLFDLADVRMLSAFARNGLLRQPVLVQINFFFDLIRGPTPGIAALDAFLAEWRIAEVDSELCLFVRSMPDRQSYERLFEAAIERGVHIRVGLGDNPHLFPNGRSADMVDHAVEMASRRGLKPATPAELRSRINVAARP